MANTYNQITIGADPEFLMVDCCGGPVCFDEIAHRITIPKYGNLGMDGGGVLAEIRPKYSKNPIVVVENISKLLKYFYEKQSDTHDVQWIAGSYYNNVPIGGHIHLGNLSDHIMHDINTAIYYKYAKLVKALDITLGLTYLQLEQNEAVRQRINIGYGGLSALRNQYRQRIEYRTPGSWLTSPHVTLGFLSFAKLVGEHACADDNLFHDLVKHEKRRYVPHNYTRSERKKLLAGVFSIVDKSPCYTEGIDFLRWMVHNDLTWHRSRNKDIKQNWNVNV